MFCLFILKGFKMEKVSIVVINYNDKLRINRAIDSAINQTYQNKEIIIVDDGSDNDTRKLYKKYLNNSNVKFVQLERNDLNLRTPSRARNEGFKVCTGEYVCFLDSDNYFSKDFVNEMYKTGADVAFCNWEIIGKKPYKIEIENVWDLKTEVLENYLRFTHLDHQCLLIKKDILKKLNDNGLPYDVRLPRSQDCDVIVGLCLLTKNWKHVQKNLFTFETHEEDQMKQFASIHGKTLWTLKRGLNIQWLLGVISQNQGLIISYYKAIKDFSENKEWEEDYNKSEFKEFFEQSIEKIIGERKEKI